MGCVRLLVAGDEVDEASGALWAHEPLAVGEEVLDDGRVSLLAGFPDAATAAQVVAALPRRWLPTVEAVPDEASWRDAWRAHAEPVTVGRVLLWPSWWEQSAPDHDGVTVRLDPGWAFGSGSHPSTRMALAAVAGLVPPARRVLDVGCGSGVLAVAAALLGAPTVVAVDVDPEARRATAANAAVNAVAGRVGIAASLPEDATFDLVVANIGAAVVTDLAGPMAATVADGGRLVLGGLLVEQAPAVVAAYLRQPGGFQLVSTEVEDGWAGPVLARAPALTPPRPGPGRR